MVDQTASFAGGIMADFNVYARQYPVIAGAVSLWLLGIFSYLMRNIPNKVFKLLNKQCFTRLSLMSTSGSYHNFLEWLETNGYTKKIRSLKITCGRYGDESATKSIGYGEHYFLYKFRLFSLKMNRIETNAHMEKDEIIISVLGRSQKFLGKIFDEINNMNLEKDNLIVHKYNGECWSQTSEQCKRNIDTVFLNVDVKNTVINYIENFIEKEDWYINNGLSYQTGILLYGPPGCGKTSLVKAVASMLNREIYVLSASRLSYIENAMSNLPKNSILLIEDIDTESVTINRFTTSGSDKSNTEDQFSFANLSDILNSIDGIVSSHGRILIATTNHESKLDKALTREGRFDLKIELKHADNSVVKQFFNNYYPNFEIPKDFNVGDGVSSAKIQSLIFKNIGSPEKVIKYIGKV